MTPAALAARVRSGDARAAAWLMRALEDADVTSPASRATASQAEAVLADATLRRLFRDAGAALVLGITGPPGAGKSTLVDALIAAFRAGGMRVGVVAIDPSSPLTGGAILGDRIRMQRHSTDPGVFIRSLATRGQLGGLSRAAADVVTVLAAMGAGVVIVETVGVGQDEIDIVRLADLVAVTLVPGLGDDVQTLKAGLLEVADLFIVNKADRPGADQVAADLAGMLALRTGIGDSPPIEIVRTVAARGEGIDEVMAAVNRHQQHQQASGQAERRRHRQAGLRVRALLLDRLTRRVDSLLTRQDRGTAFDRLIGEVAARHTDPRSAAEAIEAAASDISHPDSGENP